MSRIRLACVLALLARTALAQQGRINISGGTGTDVLGVTTSAVTVAPSVVLSADPRAVFTLGGNGTRFDNNAWALGGRATAAFRAPAGEHAALTLNGSGAVTTTSY